MVVYVVMYNIAYEGANVVKVFADRESAEKYVEEQNKPINQNSEWYDFEEWKVD